MKGFFAVSIALVCFFVLLELDAMQFDLRKEARETERELLFLDKAYYAEEAIKQAVGQAFNSSEESRFECVSQVAQRLRELEAVVEPEVDGFRVDFWFGFATRQELDALVFSNETKCADCFDFDEASVDYSGNESAKALMVLDCASGNAFVSRNGLSFVPREAREFNARPGDAVIAAVLQADGFKRVMVVE
ncbi:MAG: hypothetical protein V1834_00070 [Candidatus Micrarchaeota archaeon]